MRYTSSINNVKCVEWGINLAQGQLIDLINQASSWAKPHIVDNELYFWVSRNKVIEEIPVAYQKPDTVYRAIKDLASKGIIDHIKQGRKDLVRLTEKGMTWNVKDTTQGDAKLGNKSDFKCGNSEINPSKLGNKSEKTPQNSEINPTDKSTNYKNTNNNINKKNTKKTKSKTQSAVETYKPQKPDEVSDQVWSDLISHRKIKKTSNTQTAWNVIFSQLKKAKQATGHSLDQIITEWITRDWKGFKSDWYINIQNKTQSTGNNHAINQPASTTSNNQVRKSSTDIYAEKLAREFEQRYGQQSTTIRDVN